MWLEIIRLFGNLNFTFFITCEMFLNSVLPVITINPEKGKALMKVLWLITIKIRVMFFDGVLPVCLMNIINFVILSICVIL